jgi:hypothetical protein
MSRSCQDRGSNPPAGAPGSLLSRCRAVTSWISRSSRLPPFISGVTRHTPPVSAANPSNGIRFTCRQTHCTCTSCRNSVCPCMLPRSSLLMARSAPLIPRSCTVKNTLPKPPPPMRCESANPEVAAANSLEKKMNNDVRPTSCALIPRSRGPRRSAACAVAVMRCTSARASAVMRCASACASRMSRAINTCSSSYLPNDIQSFSSAKKILLVPLSTRPFHLPSPSPSHLLLSIRLASVILRLLRLLPPPSSLPLLPPPYRSYSSMLPSVSELIKSKASDC